WPAGQPEPRWRPAPPRAARRRGRRNLNQKERTRRHEAQKKQIAERILAKSAGQLVRARTGAPQQRSPSAVRAARKMSVAPIVALITAAEAPSTSPKRKPPVTVRNTAPGTECATVTM